MKFITKVKNQISKLFREVFYLERINSRRCNMDNIDTSQTILEHKE